MLRLIMLATIERKTFIIWRLVYRRLYRDDSSNFFERLIFCYFLIVNTLEAWIDNARWLIVQLVESLKVLLLIKSIVRSLGKILYTLTCSGILWYYRLHLIYLLNFLRFLQLLIETSYLAFQFFYFSLIPSIL